MTTFHHLIDDAREKIVVCRAVHLVKISRGLVPSH